MSPIQMILHPTDFSEQSKHAFHLACSLARDQSTRLLLLHVMPVPLVEEKRGYQQEMAEVLNSIEVPDGTIRVERRLEEGDPATQIVRVAQETGCDLIVLGTHGRAGLARLLMGSTAEQVMRLAPCSVVTLKAPFPKAGSGAPERAGRTFETTRR
jgi:nucleotide-binding universal stress UspA family protein